MTNDFFLSEEYRHQCEVRVYLRERSQRGKEHLRKLLNNPNVSNRRDRLANDIWEQWTLGNRGEHGCWKESSSGQQESDIFVLE
jgi:hypothetical protein